MNLRKLLSPLFAIALLAGTPGAEEFHVYPDRLEDAAGQVVPKSWKFKPSQSFAQALFLAGATAGGDVVWIHGDVVGNGNVTLGQYANPLGNKLGGLVGCQVLAATSGARIPGLNVFQQHEVSGLLFRGLEIAANTDNQCVKWGKNQPAEHRDFVFVDCRFDGFSTQVGQAAWGLQVGGPIVGLDVVDSDFVDFREHGGYMHGAAWSTYDGCTFTRCGYTGTQWTNRAWEGRPSYGTNTVKDCTFTQCGEGGAASVTVGGHTGLFVVENITVDTDHPTGGVLFYWEGPKPKNTQGPTDVGAWRDENGWGISEVMMIGRSSIRMGAKAFYLTSFNDVGRVTIGPMQFHATDAPKPCIWIHRPKTGRGIGQLVLGMDSGSDAVWNGNEKVREVDTAWPDSKVDDHVQQRPPARALQPAGGG